MTDDLTNYWIDIILERFKLLQKNGPDRSRNDIEKELLDWAEKNEAKVYSEFFKTRGKCPLTTIMRNQRLIPSNRTESAHRYTC